MKDFAELKELVSKKGFGTGLYGNVNGDPVYLSRGIREIYLGEENIQKVIDVVSRFQEGDYGDAAEHGKVPAPGHEYGRYDILALPHDAEDDAAVWIHKDGEAVIVYFRFER